MKRRPKGPIGGGGARHPNSLANLKQAPPAPAGNGRRMAHGAYAELLLRDVEAEVRELMDALGEAVPVRDGDGSVPLADVAAIELAARALKRYRSISHWCDLHGRIRERSGAVKPAADLELKAHRVLHEALDALGMTPTSRAKLGVDLVRARDLALEMSALAAEEDAAGGAGAS